jgi:hypothetical protein
MAGHHHGRLRHRRLHPAPAGTAHDVLARAFATVMGAARLAAAATIVGSGAAANPAPTAASNLTAARDMMRRMLLTFRERGARSSIAYRHATLLLAGCRDVPIPIVILLALFWRTSLKHLRSFDAASTPQVMAAPLSDRQMRIIPECGYGRPNAPDRLPLSPALWGRPCASTFCLSLVSRFPRACRTTPRTFPSS